MPGSVLGRPVSPALIELPDRLFERLEMYILALD